MDADRDDPALARRQRDRPRADRDPRAYATPRLRAVEVDGAARLAGGRVDRVEKRGAALLAEVPDPEAVHVGLPAVSRHAELDVDDRDVVVGHIDIVEAEAIELGVRSHPHPVVSGDLLRVWIWRTEGRTAVV